MLDMTRKLAMDQARLIKKIEELTRRVETLESKRDSSGTLRLSEVSKRSPKKPKSANAKA